MTTSDSRRGGILTGLMLTVLCLVGFVAAVGLIVAWNVARNVRVESTYGRNRDVSIETPAGNFSIHAHKEPGLELADIPAYPGARRKKSSGGGAVFEWTSSHGTDDKAFTVAGEEMITGDRAAQVLDFYKEQLPNWAVSHERNGQFHLELRKDGFTRFIVIDEKYDGTHIGVASIGGPASN